MGYEDLQPHDTDTLEKGRRKQPDRGYPPLEGRYYIASDIWKTMVRAGEIVIPEGPWSITDHPNRRGKDPALLDPIATTDSPLTDEQAAHWRAMGLLTDTANRPLHPRAAQLLTTPGVGMFTQPGFHYRYGPQRMSNLGVRRVYSGRVEYAVVAVQRDKLSWGLPGGYADPGETPEQSAFREGLEEANIQRALLGRMAMQELFTFPKGFKRDTLHAWGEQHFLFVQSLDNPVLEGVELATNDPEEVLDVQWMDIRDIMTRPNFLSVHADMIAGYETGLKDQPSHLHI